MTSNGWSEIVLVVTVLAPLVAIAVTVGVALPIDDRRWTALGCGVTAAGAFLLLVTGQRPSIAGLAPDDLALVAMFATALLALTARAVARPPIVGAIVTVAVAAIATGRPDRPSTVGLVVGIAVAIALLAASRDAGVIVVAVLAAGTIAMAAGVRAGGRGGAAVAVIAVAVVATAACIVPRRAATLVVPGALTLGLRVSPALANTATARWVAAVLGCIAVVVVLAPVVVSRVRPPAATAALVPWVLVAAAAAVPGTDGASRALAAGVVLSLALGGDLALVAALPGAAALIAAIGDATGWPRLALGVLAAATVAGILRARPPATNGRMRVIDGVVLALSIWFVVRPTAWEWARVSNVEAYTDGALLAVASALIVTVVLSAAGGRLELAPLVSHLVVDDDERAVTTRFVPAVALGVATVAIVALLVRSARL